MGQGWASSHFWGLGHIILKPQGLRRGWVRKDTEPHSHDSLPSEKQNQLLQGPQTSRLRLIMATEFPPNPHHFLLGQQSRNRDSSPDSAMTSLQNLGQGITYPLFHLQNVDQNTILPHLTR